MGWGVLLLDGGQGGVFCFWVGVGCFAFLGGVVWCNFLLGRGGVFFFWAGGGVRGVMMKNVFKIWMRELWDELGILLYLSTHTPSLLTTHFGVDTATFRVIISLHRQLAI